MADHLRTRLREKLDSLIIVLAGVLLIASVLAVAVWLGITTAGSQALCDGASGTVVEGPSCG